MNMKAFLDEFLVLSLQKEKIARLNPDHLKLLKHPGFKYPAAALGGIIGWETVGGQIGKLKRQRDIGAAYEAAMERQQEQMRNQRGG